MTRRIPFKSGVHQILAAMLMAVAVIPAMAQEITVLRNVTLIDGLSDAAQPGMSVVVEGNTIRDILGPNDTLPPRAEVIDLSGKYLMPGMIDSHVHWLDWMGELYVNYGVTSVVALADLKKPFREQSQSSHAYPRLYHSGDRPPFGRDDSPSEIRTIIREWLKKEPDIAHFPTHDRRISAAWKAAAAEVHRQGFMIFGHAENAVDSIADGHDVLEHIWPYGQAVMSAEELAAFQRGDYLTWAHLMGDNWDEIDRLIRQTVDAGLYLNPTLLYEWGGMSAHADARELQDYSVFRDPELAYFPTNIAQSLLAKHRQIKNFSRRYENLPMVSLLPAEDRAVFAEGYRNIKEFMRRYAAAGGKIQAGTDAITAGIPGLGLHQELQMLVEAGVPPMQAIKAATRWSAELLEGKNGKRGPAAVGSIETGKKADMIVLDADPLADIANTLAINRIMKDGRWLNRGLHREYYSHTTPPRSIAGSTFAPVISSVSPAQVKAGSPTTRIVLEGSGFQLISMVQVNGVTVKTDFLSPRMIAFDMPESVLARATPNPYTSPGPYQQNGIVGFRAVEISVFSPPPEGGMSNSINLMVTP